MSFCALVPQFATTDITPSSCATFMLARRSGSRIAAPFEIVGSRPSPSPNSFIFSSSSFASEMAVGSRSSMSGRLARTFWISGVAFASGGVKVSSTTSVRPSFASCVARIGFTNASDAAVLSITMPTVFGRLPEDFSAIASNAGSEPSACWSPVADVWKTYLKPRAVIWSEYENVTMGNCARSVTSVTASVNELRYAPVAATRCGASATMRCAAFFAFSTLSPASNTESFSFAPPSDRIPPCWLIAAIASSAADFITCPCRAHGPDIGAMRPTSMSGAARTPVAASASPAATAMPAKRRRRASIECCVMVLPPVRCRGGPDAKARTALRPTCRDTPAAPGRRS